MSTLVALDVFLARYAPAWPSGPDGDVGTWDDAVAVTSLSELESDRVAALIFEIETRGLDEAVVVSEDPDRVANGMHRVLAHIALGRAVPVTTRDAAVPRCCSVTSVLVRPEADPDYDEALCSVLSFRLDERTWVESDGWGSTGVVGTDQVRIEITWCSDLSGSVDELHAALAPRLLRAGLDVVTMWTVLEDLGGPDLDTPAHS